MYLAEHHLAYTGLCPGILEEDVLSIRTRNEYSQQSWELVNVVYFLGTN